MPAPEDAPSLAACGGSGRQSCPCSTGPDAATAVPPATLDAGGAGPPARARPRRPHGVVQRVLETFEASLARLLGQLRAERERGDPAVVAGIAHTLKSSSASVGALALSRLLRRDRAPAARRRPTATCTPTCSDCSPRASARCAAVGAMLRPVTPDRR